MTRAVDKLVGSADVNASLAEIRKRWMTMEGVRKQFQGEPAEELESYFRTCRLRIESRLDEIGGTHTVAPQQPEAIRQTIKAIKEEIEFVDKVFTCVLRL